MIGVTLDRVSKTFGAAKGVENVDVHIKPGEFFTFLGPSGCGKTTTLRMIAGFYYPSDGRILFGEQNVTHMPPNKRNTGMVFQNYALFPHMTVFENIAFGLQVRKQGKAEIHDKVTRAQKLVHLDGYGQRRIDQLSGGQQQRVALARALVIEPNILLLDEPLSNLDAKLREETRQEIKRLQLELGITTIYVTHDQSEAMSMSDRIMVMKDGVVQQIGTPHEIYNLLSQPFRRFVHRRVESVGGNGGTARRRHGRRSRNSGFAADRSLAENASPECKLTAGQKVTLSVRPEAIREASPSERGEANTMAAKVLLSEFTGISVNYIAQAGPLSVKAMFVGQGHRMRNRDEDVWFAVARDSIYFLG